MINTEGLVSLGNMSRKRPQQMTRGFTLIEIMIVVTIIAALALLAWPNFVKSRSRAQVGACINNLKKLEGAKSQWAFENRKNNTDVPQMTDVIPYLQHDNTPSCPADGAYRLRRVSKQPTCSNYSTGHSLANLNQDDDPDVD
jgi:prepilin-type N-terminal cleavage/methylation domain-containing protein